MTHEPVDFRDHVKSIKVLIDINERLAMEKCSLEKEAEELKKEIANMKVNKPTYHNDIILLIWVMDTTLLLELVKDVFRVSILVILFSFLCFSLAYSKRKKS